MMIEMLKEAAKSARNCGGEIEVVPEGFRVRHATDFSGMNKLVSFEAFEAARHNILQDALSDCINGAEWES